MMCGVVRRAVLALAILMVPMAVFAQEAVLTGSVTDSTGGVLPGVTVTASNEATGNKFVGVTDEKGIYRIPVRIGSYVITGELSGFTSATRNGVQLLVGQTASIDLRMSPSTVTETVTVTGEAPLIDLKNSSIGGNVDPKQVQELPVYGRNWMALALVAPGSRTDPFASGTAAQTPLPDRNNGEAREFQLNVDGQQVSADIGTGGQPKYSQDSIAEFQFVANRFDATMGRSTGVQVNAITKSGSNQLQGLVRGNFRDDRFNAKNPVLNRVEPINNQQYSFTLGGPLVKDKLHYFANYEYERQPQTAIFNTPYPKFNVDVSGTDTQKKGGVRLDYQLSTNTRIMGKVSRGVQNQPMVPGNTQTYPSAVGTNREYNDERTFNFTQVISNKAVNEIKGGEAVFGLANQNLTTWSNHWQKADGINTGSPRITFRGFTIGGNQNYPRHQDQWVWNVRDDFTYSYDAKGRHDVRLGGEFLHRHQIQDNCRQCMGTLQANGIAAPTADQMQAWFPNPFNADTWNLAAISPWVTTYSIGVGDFNVHLRSKKFAAWLQDDWNISDRLTLNLGLRYDLAVNAFANNITVEPFQKAGRPNDTKNIQPRLGFNFKVDNRTVVRGGAGLYYGDALGADQSFATGNAQLVVISYANNGRPDFAANPMGNGVLPTYAQALTRFCYANSNAPGCLVRDLQEFVGPPQFVHLPRTFQTSIGLQRQFTATTALNADFVWFKGDHEKDVVDNINVSYNPTTGLPLSFANRANRPYPEWGIVSMNSHLGKSEYRGLQTSLTKRFSQNWQGSVNYTLSWLYNSATKPFSGLTQPSFAIAPGISGEWGLSADDQRHRLVFNGIWQAYKGLQVSGLHYLGAGIRDSIIYGGDTIGLGCACYEQRIRPNGTVIPRNAFIAPAQNRTDLRLQQKITIGGRRSFDVIADVFNIFNRPNWTVGVNEATPAQFLQHVNGTFRTMQFGFRLSY
jgi:hypothetical protein